MFENDNTNGSFSNNGPTKPRKTNWLPWMIVAGMGILLLYQYIGTPASSANAAVPFSRGITWLPLLAGLICPLMMLFMMSGHGHGNDNNQSGANDQENPNGKSSHGGCCGGHQTNKGAGK